MLTPGVYDYRRLFQDSEGGLAQLPDRSPGAQIMPCDANKWTIRVYVVTDGPVLPRGPVTVQMQRTGHLAETRTTQFVKEQAAGLLWNGSGNRIYTASVVAPVNWQVVGSHTLSIANGDDKVVVLKLNPPAVWVRFRVIYDKTNVPVNAEPLRGRIPLLAGAQVITVPTGADGIVQHEALQAGADASIHSVGTQDNTDIWQAVIMETS